MEYKTKRLILRTLETEDVKLLHEYYQRNMLFLNPWEPSRSMEYYSQNSLLRMIKAEVLEQKSKSALRLYLLPSDNKRIIGFTGLSNIVYGPFQSCFLGYKMDKDEINKGYMTEALHKLVEIAFKDYHLHRIESNVIPRNLPSRRVMNKMKFKEEGSSPRYLKINGKWEDHIHYVLLNSAVE